MTIKNLLNALPVLQKLAKQELTIKTLYKVSKLLSKLDEELAIYDKTRISLIREYCNEIDGKYIPREETEKEFNEKFTELLSLAVDMGDLKPVNIPVDEKLTLSYNDLQAIKDFIIIDFEEDN